MTEHEKVELAILRTIYQMDASSAALRPVRQAFLQLAKELQSDQVLPPYGSDSELVMLRNATG